LSACWRRFGLPERIRDRDADFGPTLACEKLWECHGIRLAKETVRKLIYAVAAASNPRKR